ncbi:MAG: hypothetical protein Q9162_001425 [Coniocarpon cinnabarinum]
MGRNDDNFSRIIASISAMVFLGTPHRGSNLAKLLNKLLAVSRIGPSPKQYVADLAEDSSAIEELNDQFRNIPTKIEITSFYETRYSTAAYRKLIVKKESSIIGCRGEISQPLNADHHNLCKFASPDDDNYVSVRNTLRSIIASFHGSGTPKQESFSNPMEKVCTLLGISEAPEDDLNFYYDRRMADTCSWVLSDAKFLDWMQHKSSSQTLWISGPPGSGKSILSSFLVKHFRAEDIDCSYFFFRGANRSQRSAGWFLRSIAFQIAQTRPVYRQRLQWLCDAGKRLEKSDPESLWQKLFASALKQVELSAPIYIVLDGLDESDSHQTLLALLSSASSNIPIRSVIVSRPTDAITRAFERFDSSTPITRLSVESAGKDIPMFVERELQSMRGDAELRRQVTNQIIQRASGNFLWVHFAVKEAVSCHTQQQIEEVLHDLPEGMHPLYQRMEESMTRSLKPSNLSLAKALLASVGCAQRPLNLDELNKVLEPEFAHLIDLKHTISQICGDILVVDRKDRVTFVHETARDFLIKASQGPLRIDPVTIHQILLLRCIAYLSDPKLSSQVGQNPPPVLLHYAAESWSFHLQARSAANEEVLVALFEFLQSSSVLTWIKALATQDKLKSLVQSSHALTAFANKRGAIDSSVAPNLRPLQELETIELWATDLLKIVGKFGRNLVDNPDSIFKFIPQFCPKNSAIHRQFARNDAFSVLVSGESHNDWDDSLAKLFVGADTQALSIITTGQCFAIATSADVIILWDAATCQEVRRLLHKEHVTALCASADGKKIASYGFRTTKVWNLSTGRELHSIPNSSDSRALCIAFANMDTILLTGSDDRIIRQVSLDKSMDGWQTVGSDFLADGSNAVGTINSPSCLAFDPEGTHVAMGFRGAPLAVFPVENPAQVLRCRRVRETQAGTSARSWTSVDHVIWHPRSAEVLGIYQDGNIFKWHPFENTSREANEAASAIACSPDGDIFATSDVEGSVKIWKHYDFAPIYQLRCEHPVTDLAFSPDNRRLYDLRGSCCNVWEPNVLVRMADLDKSGSEAASDSVSTALSTTISEAQADIMEPVTALAAGPRGQFHVFGNAEGEVKLLQSSTNQVVEEWTSSNFMPIEQIACSADGKHVAWRDLGGKVIVKQLQPDKLAGKSSQQPSQTVFDATVTSEDGPTQQLLLSNTSEYILITGHTSAQLWSGKDGSRITSWNSPNVDAFFRWMNHPCHQDQLLAIGADNAFACQWQDLTITSSMKFQTPKPHKSAQRRGNIDQVRRPSGPRTMSSDNINPIVENAMLTQDGAHLMVETSRGSDHETSERQLMMFSKSELLGTLSHLTPKSLPFLLWSKLQLPLGVLPGDKFVFLDNEHWLCSWQLNSGDGSSGLERHFFLPRDWLNAECLECCLVLGNGALLIPKNGEVASIKSDVGLQW